MIHQVFLPMDPPTATAQTREVRIVKGKPVFYKPARLVQAEHLLRKGLARHRPEQPFTSGVRLIVKWCFRRTGRHHDGEYKLTRPDTDNLNKLLKDVMTSLGYWTDDSLVCSEVIEKFWADVPGIFIRIEAIS